MKTKSFTLIEILVALVILGILSTFIIISLSNVVDSANDVKRKKDLDSISKALMEYRIMTGSYPEETSDCNIGDGTCLDELINYEYAKEFPLDPSGDRYKYTSDGITYTIKATLSDGQILAYSPDTGYSTILPFVCGTSTVTFTYKGSSVTYGTVNSPTGKCWLDRNLGATQVALSSTDANAYGDLFQWGRLDDGHQVRTSGTTSTRSTTDVPGHGDFITYGSSPYDWRNPQNNNLWQGVSGTNNPCPTGFRIPTQTELNAERLTWSSNNSAGAFASTLKLTVAGLRYRDDGSIGSVGTYGSYWASVITSTSSYYLYFNSSSADTGTYSRAYGLSVRCIKD